MTDKTKQLICLPTDRDKQLIRLSGYTLESNILQYTQDDIAAIGCFMDFLDCLSAMARRFR